MTGPEHYRAAETLLGRAAHAPGEGYVDVVDCGQYLAEALVHATLAAAAAAALCTVNPDVGGVTLDEWWEVAGSPPGPERVVGRGAPGRAAVGPRERTIGGHCGELR